jgi:hypothetical protein
MGWEREGVLVMAGTSNTHYLFLMFEQSLQDKLNQSFYLLSVESITTHLNYFFPHRLNQALVEQP